MLTSTARSAVKRSLGRWLSSSVAHPSQKIAPLQEASLKEQCYLTDENDKIIGTASKRDCHLVKADGSVPLHRAFSVFLFNKAGDMLLQKRASQKVTYPGYYSNSCCSHPLADFPEEAEEKDGLGVKKAAQRRLNYELGIPIESIPLEKFTYLTRVLYMDGGDGKWGEHEIDYILFLKDDVQVNPNSSEISAISYIPRSELDAYIPTLDGPLTPWFAFILKNRLKLWWDNLDELEQFKDHEKIINVGTCPC